MGDRFLFVRYEDLCDDPRGELGRLLRFCGVEDADGAAERLAEGVRPPSDRGRGLGITGLDPDDVAYVRSLGFVTSGVTPTDVVSERGPKVSSGRPVGVDRHIAAKDR
jgi:hypothetical protein